MRKVMVWLKDKNYEQPVEDICPYSWDELVDHRVFENLQDVQYTLLALSRGSRFALEHGLACPRDTRKAVEKITALSKY